MNDFCCFTLNGLPPQSVPAARTFLSQLTDVKLVRTLSPMHQLTLPPEVLISQIYMGSSCWSLGLTSVTTSLTPLPRSPHSSITLPFYGLHSLEVKLTPASGSLLPAKQAEFRALWL